MIRECSALCKHGGKCTRRAVWLLRDGGKVLLRFCSQHAKRVRALLVEERRKLEYREGESPESGAGPTP